MGYTTKLAHHDSFCWANSCPALHTSNMKNPLSLVWAFGRRMDAGEVWLPAASIDLKHSSRRVTTLQGQPHHFQTFQSSRGVTAMLCRELEIFVLNRATTPFLFNSKEKEKKKINGHIILPKVTWDPDLFFALRNPLLLSSCRALSSTKKTLPTNFHVTVRSSHFPLSPQQSQFPSVLVLAKLHEYVSPPLLGACLEETCTFEMFIFLLSLAWERIRV